MSECEHEIYNQIGKMEETKIDGLYAIPFKCCKCNKTVYEQYSYNGIVENKNVKNG